MSSHPTSYSEIAPFRSPSPPEGFALVREKRPMQLTRKTFLKGTATVGIAAGVGLLNLFPGARRAQAHHGVKYEIKALPCPDYAFYDTNPVCLPCGGNTVYSGACIWDTSEHYFGYHKDNANWELRSDECTNAGHDGWIWRADGTHCGIAGCQDWVKWRCADGWKLNDNGTHLDKSICAYPCDCGGLQINDCDPTP